MKLRKRSRKQRSRTNWAHYGRSANLRFERLEERLALSTIGGAISGLEGLKDWARDVVANVPHEKPLFFTEIGLSVDKFGFGFSGGIGVAVDLADLAGLTSDAADHFTTVWVYEYGSVGESISILGTLLELSPVKPDLSQKRLTLDADFQSDPNLTTDFLHLLDLADLPSLNDNLLTTSLGVTVKTRHQLMKFEENTDLVSASIVDTTGITGLLRMLAPEIAQLGALAYLPDAVSSLVAGVGFRWEKNEPSSGPSCPLPSLPIAQDRALLQVTESPGLSGGAEVAVLCGRG